MKAVCLILVIILTDLKLSAQADSLKYRNDSIAGREYLLQKVTRNGVTLPEIDIKEVTISADPRKRSRREAVLDRRYERLVYNLKIVYPYSLIVREKLTEVNKDLISLKTDKERRQYVKNVEKDIFGRYEGNIRQLTITQGRLLLKLIDRETQNTSYDLIKEYRGGLSAAFWQGIARIFGTNLKEQYDPFGDDFIIEYVVSQIEQGKL